jgi:hypothetical protein
MTQALRSFLSSTSLALALLTAAGCGQSFWTPVHWSSTNPLQGQRNFVVEPIHYEKTLINHKAEEEFLGDRSGKQAESWLADKADSNTIFLQHLKEAAAEMNIAPATQPPGPGTFLIRPVCTSIETGHFKATTIDQNTEMRLTIQVLDSSGGLIDEITLAIAAPAQVWNPSSGGRLRSVAKAHGKQVANYLHVRTGL